MALEESRFDALAQEIQEAEKTCIPSTNLTNRYSGITVAEAYSIQLRTVQAKINQGRVVVGKKIGLCSRAMQELLGVHEPDYGHILDNMVVPEGVPISMGRLVQPKMEGEICFLLRKDLKGPGVNVAQVLEATVGVMPALEIIDSRFEGWKIKIQDTVADNGGSALVVLGGQLTPVDGIDLRLVGMVLEKNGEITATGAGAAVLGNPAQAVAWLANMLGEHGISLNAGEFIMSGSVTAAVPIAAGDCFRAAFDRLGSVTARFTG